MAHSQAPGSLPACVTAAGMEKFAKDPRMEARGDMPFDGKRIGSGGFVPVAACRRSHDASISARPIRLAR
ncbi:hypothetical protein [Rhodanobacter soli]